MTINEGRDQIKSWQESILTAQENDMWEIVPYFEANIERMNKRIENAKWSTVTFAQVRTALADR